MLIIRTVFAILALVILGMLYAALLAVCIIVSSGHAIAIQIDPFVPHLIIY